MWIKAKQLLCSRTKWQHLEACISYMSHELHGSVKENRWDDNTLPPPFFLKTIFKKWDVCFQWARSFGALPWKAWQRPPSAKHKPTCMRTVCGGGEEETWAGRLRPEKVWGEEIFFFFWWKSPRGGGMRYSVITCLPRSLELFLLLRNSDNTASQWKTKRPLWLVSRLRPISLPLRRLLWNKIGLTCKGKNVDLQQRSFFIYGTGLGDSSDTVPSDL